MIYYQKILKYKYIYIDVYYIYYILNLYMLLRILNVMN